jgi:hypothetical protein
MALLRFAALYDPAFTAQEKWHRQTGAIAGKHFF